MSLDKARGSDEAVTSPTSLFRPTLGGMTQLYGEYYIADRDECQVSIGRISQHAVTGSIVRFVFGKRRIHRVLG